MTAHSPEKWVRWGTPCPEGLALGSASQHLGPHCSGCPTVWPGDPSLSQEAGWSRPFPQAEHVTPHRTPALSSSPDTSEMSNHLIELNIFLNNSEPELDMMAQTVGSHQVS